MSRTTALAKAALSYAEAGWHVHPLRPKAKQPLTPHGVKDATDNPALVEEWWRRWPTANIGLAIPPHCLVVDIDSPEAWGTLQAEDLTLPSTASASTGRGRHLWYTLAKPSGANRVGLFPGLDIRAHGGYVVAPPSVHPTGTVYTWEVDLELRNLCRCPQWLLDRLRPLEQRAPGQGPRGRSAEEWFEAVSNTVTEGNRNQALAQLSGLLFRRLPAKVAADLAQCWAKARLSPPLSGHEAQRTIDSIAGRELRRRGGTP